LIYINKRPCFPGLNAPCNPIIGVGTREKRMKALLAAAVTAFAMSGAHAQNVDVGAAEALAKKSGCMKCHSVTAKKDGPSFKTTAEKYKSKPDAQAALYKHLTSNPTIKIDGNEEKHESPKTKDDAEIKNLVAYILSR
jgi:cytochrome c